MTNHKERVHIMSITRLEEKQYYMIEINTNTYLVMLPTEELTAYSAVDDCWYIIQFFLCADVT